MSFLKNYDIWNAAQATESDGSKNCLYHPDEILGHDWLITNAKLKIWHEF